jgi:hypothetical protein
VKKKRAVIRRRKSWIRKSKIKSEKDNRTINPESEKEDKNLRKHKLKKLQIRC